MLLTIRMQQRLQEMVPNIETLPFYWETDKQVNVSMSDGSKSYRDESVPGRQERAMLPKRAE
jgi:hypothetical protein